WILTPLKSDSSLDPNELGGTRTAGPSVEQWLADASRVPELRSSTKQLTAFLRMRDLDLGSERWDHSPAKLLGCLGEIGGDRGVAQLAIGWWVQDDGPYRPPRTVKDWEIAWRLD